MDGEAIGEVTYGLGDGRGGQGRGWPVRKTKHKVEEGVCQYLYHARVLGKRVATRSSFYLPIVSMYSNTF